MKKVQRYFLDYEFFKNNKSLEIKNENSIKIILNDKKNVLGLMPHPERAVEQSLGSEDGKHIFEGVLR